MGEDFIGFGDVVEALQAEPEGLGAGVGVGVELLAMPPVHLAALVEANGNFQNQKEVVAGVADARSGAWPRSAREAEREAEGF